jgi:hypothetical protein
MKNYTLFFIILLVGTLNLFGKDSRKQKVESFNEVSLAIPGKAYVRQGDGYSVELEGPDDLLEEIEAVVEGGQLVIRTRDRWRSWRLSDSREWKNVTARVTMKEINGLHVSGSGEMLVMTRVKTNRLTLKVSGSGTLKTEVEGAAVKANISGSGKMVLRGRAESLESNISGSGRLEVDAVITGLARFNLSGSGSVLAQGEAQEVDTVISGSGKVLASNLKTQTCEVTISGSGTTEINVTDKLTARISGSGDVYYTGTPQHINVHSSGSGKVKRLNG